MDAETTSPDAWVFRETFSREYAEKLLCAANLGQGRNTEKSTSLFVHVYCTAEWGARLSVPLRRVLGFLVPWLTNMCTTSTGSFLVRESHSNLGMYTLSYVIHQSETSLYFATVVQYAQMTRAMVC